MAGTGATSTRWRLALLGGAAAALAGCAGTGKDKSFVDKVQDSLKSTLNSSYHDADAAKKFADADALYERGKYEAARAVYGKLADNSYNDAKLCEESRFREAECCQMLNWFPEAAATYNRYLQDYPGGVHGLVVAGRMFEICEFWLADVLAKYAKDHGDAAAIKLTDGGPVRPAAAPSGWLPAFVTGTKPLLDAEGTLVKTLENIAIGAPNAPCADKAMFWAGYLHYIRGRYDDADHQFSSLNEMFKDSPLRQEAARFAIDAKNRATGGAYYDGQKANEALQLVHSLEATEPMYRSNGEQSEWITKQKLNIRDGQAERDFETAEYFRRTQRYGSAYFYYELVKRRYGGTRFSDLATHRIEEMKQIQAQRDADKAAGKVSPLEAIQERLDALVGKAPADATGAAARGPGGRKTGPTTAANGFDGR